MAGNFSHNKKRNPALLYEFLVRHASKCLVNDQTEVADKVLKISKKYFSKGKPLAEELKLFRSILDTSVKSRHSAQKIIDTVCESVKGHNVRELDAEKSRLIKEVNHTFQDLGFYNYKVSDYIVYASISALLNEGRNKKKVLTDVQKIQLEDVICEYLVKQKITKPANLKKNPKYSKAVYKFVFERFRKKYDQKLNESQKNLLLTYANFKISKDDNEIKGLLRKEIKDIRVKLVVVKDESVREDQNLMSKIQKCSKKLSSANTIEVSDEVVLEVLQYMQLIEEVES